MTRGLPPAPSSPWVWFAPAAFPPVTANILPPLRGYALPGVVFVALNRMIDTRCILALAGALYSLFVISNLYILSRFSDAILMYFPIFFINSSHPINEQ